MSSYSSAANLSIIKDLIDLRKYVYEEKYTGKELLFVVLRFISPATFRFAFSLLLNLEIGFGDPEKLEYVFVWIIRALNCLMFVVRIAMHCGMMKS